MKRKVKIGRLVLVIAITGFTLYGAYNAFKPIAIGLGSYVNRNQESTPLSDLIAEEPVELESLGFFTLTAYCDCSECQGKWVGQTSTGATPTPGRTIAVDPTVIPYGTHVLIDGIEYVAEDCGGAIKGYRIDIFVGSHKDTFKKEFNKTTEVFLIK